jgi:magnesium chelatase family protein
MNKIFCIGTIKDQFFEVEVETDIGRGIFRFDIIGLGDKAVTESKLRIISAIKNSDIIIKSRLKHKITILLSPSYAKKEGSHFDLSIAISYLEKQDLLTLNTENPTGLQDHIQNNKPINVFIFGELSLSGAIKNTKDFRRMFDYAFFDTKTKNIDHFIVPEEALKDIRVILVDRYKNTFIPSERKSFKHSLTQKNLIYSDCLKDLILRSNNAKWQTFLDVFSKDLEKIDLSNNDVRQKDIQDICIDFSKIAGFENITRIDFDIDKVINQKHLKRALLISLSGKHHMMIKGLPGTGKSMLAKSSIQLLSYLSDIDSDHEREDKSLPRLICPHHTSSYVDIIGNQKNTGALIDADGGILLLDEWTEYDRRVIESLRQPLEEGVIREIQTDFICIATTNNCKCGYFESKKQKCTCTAISVRQYQSKLNSPVVERFEIYIESNQSPINHGIGPVQDKSDELDAISIIKTIYKVRLIQKHRQNLVITELMDTSKKDKSFLNKKIFKNILYQNSLKKLDKHTFEVFSTIIKKYDLNNRKQETLMSLSQTIADIDSYSSPKDTSNRSNIPNIQNISEKHLYEAVSYIKRS